MDPDDIHMQIEKVLSLSDIRLSYSRTRSFFSNDRKEILSGLDLTLHRGETLGIIGRNGAGKSSLLKIMAGVLQADSGHIIHHQPHLQVSLLTLQLGFQAHLTGRENAILGCLLIGLSRNEAENLLPEIIDFSGLDQAIDSSLQSYSSGMRARLGFSVAYHTQADIMLIDEVLGVGDHEFKLKSREAIYSAIRSDRTVVVVSHDEHLLADLCDSLIWVEKGRTLMQGSAREVLEAYHDYDHLVNKLSIRLKITTAECRNHPNNADPVGLLKQFRTNLKRQRDSAIETSRSSSDNGLKFYFPGTRNTMSHLLTEECGNTVWVENTQLIAAGGKHEVTRLYQQFEDILSTLSRLSKTEFRNMRSTLLSHQIVSMLHKLKGNAMSSKDNCD